MAHSSKITGKLICISQTSFCLCRHPKPHEREKKKANDFDDWNNKKCLHNLNWTEKNILSYLLDSLLSKAPVSNRLWPREATPKKSVPYGSETHWWQKTDTMNPDVFLDTQVSGPEWNWKHSSSAVKLQTVTVVFSIRSFSHVLPVLRGLFLFHNLHGSEMVDPPSDLCFCERDLSMLDRWLLGLTPVPQWPMYSQLHLEHEMCPLVPTPIRTLPGWCPHWFQPAYLTLKQPPGHRRCRFGVLALENSSVALQHHFFLKMHVAYSSKNSH